MADTRAINQVEGYTPPSLQGIQHVNTGSATAGLFNSASALVDQGSKMHTAYKKKEADAATAEATGGFASKLSKISDGAAVNKNVNQVSLQRKAFVEAIAKHPEMQSEYTKIFKDMTGKSPLGLSNDQEVKQELQNEAWKNNYGSPDATPEVNAKQLALYQATKRAGQDMEAEIKRLTYEEKKGSIEKGEVKKRTIEGLQKLTNLEFQSTQIDLEADLEAIANGADRAAIVNEWKMSKLRLSQQINQFGDLKNDEDIQALLKPTMDLYALAETQLMGDTELSVIKRDMDIAKAKNEALIMSDPQTRKLVTISNLFGNQPGISPVFSSHVLKLIADGPKDLRDIPAGKNGEVKETLSNMSKSSDAATVAEGKSIVLDTIKHMGRNGEDYSQEDILKITSMIDQPEVFSNLSRDEKDAVMQTYETYVVDAVDTALRDIRDNGNLTISVIGGYDDGGSGLQSVEFEKLESSDYAELTFDESGVHFIINPEYARDRQVQSKVREMNKRLGKVSPAVMTMSKTLGISAEEIGAKMFGIGSTEEEAQEEKKPEYGVVGTQDIQEGGRLSFEDLKKKFQEYSGDAESFLMDFLEIEQNTESEPEAEIVEESKEEPPVVPSDLAGIKALQKELGVKADGDFGKGSKAAFKAKYGVDAKMAEAPRQPLTRAGKAAQAAKASSKYDQTVLKPNKVDPDGRTKYGKIHKGRTDLEESMLTNAQKRTVVHENNQYRPKAETGWDKQTKLWTPHPSIEKGEDTLAYGHKIKGKEPSSGFVKIGGEMADYSKGITDKQALILFKQDWAIAEKGAIKLVGKNHPAELIDVVTEMVYQMGLGSVKGFPSFLRHMEAKDYNKAADEMLNSDWARVQTPGRARELASIVRSYGHE